MFRYLFRTIQGRTMCMLFIFFIITLGVSFYTIIYVSQRAINEEKENKLCGVATYLNSLLGDMTYEDILNKEHVQDGSRKEKIAALNRVLNDRVDTVAQMFRGLEVGYYSLELDAILAYGPSKEYNNTVGASIGENHPGRIVMAENSALVRIGSMVRGDIMNAMSPIERNGKVIGYAWANELTSEIEKEYHAFSSHIFLFLFLFFIVAIFLAMYLSRLMTRDMDTIVTGVKKMRSDLSTRISNVGGALRDVVDSINNMAEHIESTAKEHAALVRAEAANAAQREFLSRMSHELRTPMNGVLGMTTLAMQASTDEQRLDYLKKIQSSAKLLLGIINDILDFSKIEANKMELEKHPFNLRHSLDNMLQLVMTHAEEKTLELQVLVGEEVPQMVVGDELKLSQILLNLLGNALKFTEQGCVSLVIHSEEDQGRYKLKCSVADTGIGMDEEQISALFTPFSQGDSSTVRKYGGTGLGLAISKAFVRLMGGEIAVHSTLHKGSTFDFYIYLERFIPQDTSVEPETDDNCLARIHQGVRALLAEDVEINQEIAVTLLAGLGIVTDVAENGAAAVELYQNRQYDLIFMDIRMPVMDGLEATRIIRSIEAQSGTARIPIIAMTANAMHEDRKSSAESGMDVHISKPINIEDIRKAIDQVLGQAGGK